MYNFQIDQACQILERSPATLYSLLNGISNDWVFVNEGPESWSPYDIVGHLINGEKTDWLARTRIILDYGEEKPFEPFNRFAQEEASAGKSMPDLLEEFASLRTQTLAELATLLEQDQDFEVRGVHPDFGSVSLSQLLSAWVVHDLGHIAQIVRVMAKRYRDDVGPWVEYLPVLTDRK